MVKTKALTLREIEDLTPYCRNCGEDNRKQLAYLGAKASSEHWECRICGHRFTSTKIQETDWGVFEIA